MSRLLHSPWLWWFVSVVAFLMVTLVFVLHVTPTPGALLTRRVFDDGAVSMRARNAQFADAQIRVQRDLAYLPSGSALAGAAPRDTQLDVYRSSGASGPAPTVIWIHGGGWVSGDKADPAHYLTRLAGAGFTVVSLNYSLAPERRYPLAIAQLNEALRFVVAQASEFDVDPTRLVLAGDSAGANLASQLAAMITNPEFAREVGMIPSIGADRVRGVLLNCGVYDAYALRPQHQRRSVVTSLLSWGVDNTLWAYTGSRRAPSAQLDQMSTIRHLTPQFPPTWIGAGNDDPLTATQSVPLAAALRKLHVDTSTLIFGDAEPAQLGHEFQFELGTAAGQQALASSIDFVNRVAGGSSSD